MPQLCGDINHDYLLPKYSRDLNRDYKVEANSKEEAERIVMTSKEDALTPYQEDWGGDLQVVPESTLTEEEENSWMNKEQTKS